MMKGHESELNGEPKDHESGLNGEPDARTNDSLDTFASVKVEVGEEVNNSRPQSTTRTGKKKTLEALCSIRCHYNSMAHLRSVEEFYSPRKTGGLDTAADKILQITFSACTPRLLVQPPLPTQTQVPCTSSGSQGEDEDTTSASSDNMSDMVMTNVNLESSSETGWSVRDNPIASSSSCKSDADSDQDFVQKLSNETTRNVKYEKISTSSVDHVLNWDSEAEPHGHNRRQRIHVTSASVVLTPSKSLILNEERVIKPYDSEESDADSTKRTRKVLSRSSSSNPPQEALRRLIVEDNCSCSGKEHEVKQPAEVQEDFPKGGSVHEVEVLSPPAYLLNVKISGRFVDVISKRWRGVLSYFDLFVGGSLLIVLALPFAIMVSKLVVSSTQEKFRYVPT